MLITNSCDNYTWTLPEEYVEKARLELGETESVRTEALKQIRKWIVDHPCIQECRNGFSNGHHL
jgi:hypothetical protein